MQQDFPSDCMRYFIGDVRDRERLVQAMSGVDFVIHAAALKQVPAAEYNPMECIKTNIHGAENVIAGRAGQRTSTRSSRCRPTRPRTRSTSTARPSSSRTSCSSPPTTSRAATERGFRVVRYGNVVGSRGSVVPFFRKLIADGLRPPADHR